MKNADQPIHPTVIHFRNDVPYQVHGLTKREYFAAMAMQGILANTNFISITDYAAKEAILQADELLKQLES